MKYTSDNHSIDYVMLSFMMPIGRKDSGKEILCGDEYVQELMNSELAYLRGDFKTSISAYYNCPDNTNIKLCADVLTMVSAICLNDYFMFVEAENNLKKRMLNSNGTTAHCAEIGYNIIHASLFDYKKMPQWIVEGDFSNIEKPLLPSAVYLYAKFLQSTNRYQEMLTVSKSYLTMNRHDKVFTSLDLYMRLMCSNACRALGQVNECKKWLMETFELALPYGYITPIAESYTTLGEVLNSVIIEYYSDWYDRIIGLGERTWRNWLEAHNRMTSDNITTVLTYREYQIAIYLKHGEKYSDIARYMNLSVGRTRNIISEIYNKLCIGNRKELKDYIL